MPEKYPYPIPSHLLDKPIAFHRCYAAISGSVTAGLMLAQALYWTPREPRGDGWFYKTRDQWHEETCLTRSEQETARKKLKQRGLMQEELRGLPAQLWFKVNIEMVAQSLSGDTNS